MDTAQYTAFMREALDLAQKAQTLGEIPVGAVIVHKGKIIGRGHNLTRTNNDPSAHAEIVAIREAAQYLGNDRLPNCDLWVTLEPCAMCAGAIAHARIERLYYGAADEKAGAVDSGVQLFNQPTCHHVPEVYSGLEESEAKNLLQQFFRDRRG